MSTQSGVCGGYYQKKKQKTRKKRTVIKHLQIIIEHLKLENVVILTISNETPSYFFIIMDFISIAILLLLIPSSLTFRIFSYITAAKSPENLQNILSKQCRYGCNKKKDGIIKSRNKRYYGQN